MNASKNSLGEVVLKLRPYESSELIGSVEYATDLIYQGCYDSGTYLILKDLVRSLRDASRQ